MEEKQKINVFDQIETIELPSADAKKAVFSELEFLQNSAQVLELFAGNYFKTLVSALNI
jgi:16S rRNA G966 N2-methylase RsmD